MIESCVEHALIFVTTLDLHTTQQLLPTLANLIQLCVEIAIRDIPLGLLLTDIRNAHLNI